MRLARTGSALAGLAAIAAAIVFGWHERRAEIATDGQHAVGAAPSAPTLHRAFTSFADRNPRVGFHFASEDARQPPVCAQILQRERGGTQVEFGGDGRPRPEWRTDGSASPAVLRAPDDTTAIDLYDDDPGRPGTTWFEAGLRSIGYLNLGGRCRRSTA